MGGDAQGNLRSSGCKNLIGLDCCLDARVVAMRLKMVVGTAAQPHLPGSILSSALPKFPFTKHNVALCHSSGTMRLCGYSVDFCQPMVATGGRKKKKKKVNVVSRSFLLTLTSSLALSDPCRQLTLRGFL